MTIVEGMLRFDGSWALGCPGSTACRSFGFRLYERDRRFSGPLLRNVPVGNVPTIRHSAFASRKQTRMLSLASGLGEGRKRVLLSFGIRFGRLWSKELKLRLLGADPEVWRERCQVEAVS
jgi:hypothetical protein